MSPASTDGSSSQCERCTRRERQFTPVQDSAPESVFHHRLELFLFLQTGSGLLPCCGLNQWAQQHWGQGLPKFSHPPVVHPHPPTLHVTLSVTHLLRAEVNDCTKNFGGGDTSVKSLSHTHTHFFFFFSTSSNRNLNFYLLHLTLAIIIWPFDLMMERERKARRSPKSMGAWKPMNIHS